MLLCASFMVSLIFLPTGDNQEESAELQADPPGQLARAQDEVFRRPAGRFD